MSLLTPFSATRARRTLLAALSAATIAAGIGAPTSASAIYLPCAQYGTCKPKFNYGYGAAAILGGFALGAIAASAASANSCTYEQRQETDIYGNTYLRNVRVCY